MSSTPFVNTGDQFTVTVNGRNLKDMDAYEVQISFDTDKLGLVKADSDIRGGYTMEPKINGNNIIMAFAKTGDAATENGNMPLCTFTFNGKAEGTSNITLKSVKILNGNLAPSNYPVGNTVSITVSNPGQVTHVPVNSITVSGAGGIAAITVKGGTLQMTARVLPGDATNKEVTWSVQNGTGRAIIDADGLLTAVSNGMVTVKAMANDGSGVYGSCAVTISGQSPGTPAAPVSTPSPAASGTPGLTIKTVPDEKGVALAKVNADEFQAAIDSAKDGTVKIEVQAAGVANQIKVDLPAQQVAGAGQKQEKIEVSTGFAVISIYPDALKGDIKETSATVEISVSKVDPSTLPEEVIKEIGNNTVYDFTMSIDGKRVGGLEANAVKVALDYKLGPGEDPGKVIIYYLDDSGKLEVVRNGKYDPDSGKVEFYPKHFSKYAAAYANVTFSDIAGVPWAKESIEALAARRVIAGVGNNSFKPDANVTRAEYIKILMQAFDLADESAQCNFKDVKAGAWYYGSIAAAQKLGIVKGKDDGSFGVNDPITRQDMAVMTYRAALLVKANLNGNASTEQFADRADISAYAAEAVAAMQKAGIINGTGGGKFTPGGKATRAQAAVIIYRLFNAGNGQY
jgi:Bacterial Ig-like domain (group 2)./S-layer homology domain.